MAEEVRIGSNTWKIEDDIRIVGSKVVNKDKLKSLFGAQWKTAHIEGKFLGVGSPRKYRVSWTSFKPPFVEEYGAQHSIFRKGRNEHQSSGVKQVNAASASSTSSAHAVIESDDTSDSSDSSEGEDFDHEENQRMCTVGKRQWVTDVSLDGRAHGGYC